MCDVLLEGPRDVWQSVTEGSQNWPQNSVTYFMDGPVDLKSIWGHFGIPSWVGLTHQGDSHVSFKTFKWFKNLLRLPWQFYSHSLLKTRMIIVKKSIIQRGKAPLAPTEANAYIFVWRASLRLAETAWCISVVFQQWSHAGSFLVMSLCDDALSLTDAGSLLLRRDNYLRLVLFASSVSTSSSSSSAELRRLVEIIRPNRMETCLDCCNWIGAIHPETNKQADEQTYREVGSGSWRARARSYSEREWRKVARLSIIHFSWAVCRRMGQMQTNRFTVFQNILSLYGMELGHPVTRSFLCQSTPSSLRYGEESDVQTDIHTYTYRDRQTDRQTCIHTYIHTYIHMYVLRGLGGVVVIDAAIGAHGRSSRPVHYLTVAATLDKSFTSHCL